MARSRKTNFLNNLSLKLSVRNFSIPPIASILATALPCARSFSFASRTVNPQGFDKELNKEVATKVIDLEESGAFNNKTMLDTFTQPDNGRRTYLGQWNWFWDSGNSCT